MAGTAIDVCRLSYAYRLPRRSVRRSARVAEPHYRSALEAIDFDVQAGEIFGVLGPNGSGKTTLFRILSTLLKPPPATVRIYGYDVVGEPHKVRQRLGVVFQEPSVDLKLTARENLICHGHLYGMRGPALRQRADLLLAEMDLTERCDDMVERFSGGMRRRVELAKSLLHSPDLLLLDEPTLGLDVGSRRDLWRMLTQLRQRDGTTVVLTTHLMSDAEYCDRLAILDAGKVIAVDGPDQLKAQIGGDVILIEPVAQENIAQLQQVVIDRFGPWPANRQPKVRDGKILFEHAGGTAMVTRLASELAGQTRSITVGKPTLEDVYLHLTGHTFWKSA